MHTTSATRTGQDLQYGKWNLLVSSREILYCYPEARKCFCHGVILQQPQYRVKKSRRVLFQEGFGN